MRVSVIRSLNQISTIRSVIRVAANSRGRSKAYLEVGTDLVGASAPQRTSACLVNEVNQATIQRGYPITGVTPRSSSPFT